MKGTLNPYSYQLVTTEAAAAVVRAKRHTNWVNVKIYLVTHKCMYTNSPVNICPLLRSRSQCSGTSCNLRLIRGADVNWATKAAKHRGHYRFYILTNELLTIEAAPAVVRAERHTDT